MSQNSNTKVFTMALSGGNDYCSVACFCVTSGKSIIPLDLGFLFYKRR